MFGFGKKEVKKESACACCVDSSAAQESTSNARVKVLGGGCAKCHELHANAVAAMKELGRCETAALVTDFAVIASYGVMSTPALVIDEKVVSYGRVLKTPEVKKLLQENL